MLTSRPQTTVHPRVSWAPRQSRKPNRCTGGRYHGRSRVKQLGTPDYESNWILGDPVQFETYSSLAFDEVDNYTRSIERRMTRRYCAIYDLAVSHSLRTNPLYGKEDDYTIGKLNVIPSFTPGLYNQGDGKDLGHLVEFKSEVQLSLDLSPNTEFGFSYNHISNASLGEKNPGANSYMFNFLKSF